jgi:hypothetical protein
MTELPTLYWTIAGPDYADLRQEYEAQHRALVEAQQALDRALAEIQALRLIYPEGTADKLNLLELENERLRAQLNHNVKRK